MMQLSPEVIQKVIEERARWNGETSVDVRDEEDALVRLRNGFNILGFW